MFPGEVPMGLVLGKKDTDSGGLQPALELEPRSESRRQEQWLSGRIMKASECHGDNLGRQ